MKIVTNSHDNGDQFTWVGEGWVKFEVEMMIKLRIDRDKLT